MRRSLITPALVLASLLAAAQPACAEWLVTPYFAYNWGTTATLDDVAGPFDNSFDPRIGFGASITLPTRHGFDVEADVGIAPDLFGRLSGDTDFQYGTNRLISVMANVKATVPGMRRGRMRPFGVVGIGLLQSSIKDEFDAFDASSSNLGFDAGGGIEVPFGRLRIQGDVRYFRSLQKQTPKDELDVVIQSLHFVRATVGIIFRM